MWRNQTDKSCTPPKTISTKRVNINMTVELLENNSPKKINSDKTCGKLLMEVKYSLF